MPILVQPPPFRVPMHDAKGELAPSWSRFFLNTQLALQQIQLVTGGTMATFRSLSLDDQTDPTGEQEWMAIPSSAVVSGGGAVGPPGPPGLPGIFSGGSGDSESDGDSWPTFQSAQVVPRVVGLGVDGRGLTLTTGVKGYVAVPFSGTIIAAELISTATVAPAGQIQIATVGSIVIDVWKAPYSAYPPTVANTITAATPPTINNDIKSLDTTLTGWTTAVKTGDIFGFNVVSVTALTRIVLELTVQ